MLLPPYPFSDIWRQQHMRFPALKFFTHGWSVTIPKRKSLAGLNFSIQSRRRHQRWLVESHQVHEPWLPAAGKTAQADGSPAPTRYHCGAGERSGE